MIERMESLAFGLPVASILEHFVVRECYGGRILLLSSPMRTCR